MASWRSIWSRHFSSILSAFLAMHQPVKSLLTAPCAAPVAPGALRPPPTCAPAPSLEHVRSGASKTPKATCPDGLPGFLRDKRAADRAAALHPSGAHGLARAGSPSARPDRNRGSHGVTARPKQQGAESRDGGLGSFLPDFMGLQRQTAHWKRARSSEPMNDAINQDPSWALATPLPPPLVSFVFACRLLKAPNATAERVQGQQQPNSRAHEEYFSAERST